MRQRDREQGLGGRDEEAEEDNKAGVIPSFSSVSVSFFPVSQSSAVSSRQTATLLTLLALLCSLCSTHSTPPSPDCLSPHIHPPTRTIHPTLLYSLYPHTRHLSTYIPSPLLFLLLLPHHSPTHPLSSTNKNKYAPLQSPHHSARYPRCLRRPFVRRRRASRRMGASSSLSSFPHYPRPQKKTGPAWLP